MLQGILLAAIVILLLVVLVPVGVALYQRLRGESAAAAAPPPAPRTAPPPRDVPTAKIPSLAAMPPSVPDPPAAAAPRTAPPPAAPRPIDSTQLGALPPSAADSGPAGTAMMQWYGMLNCTAGPLQGQRFVVEDEGFYIGRDPVLAQVVIADTRVSKRHVRIVPRDGRVWAIDEGSTNGTFLSGQRITEVQLKRGDTLIIGDNAATFVYQI